MWLSSEKPRPEVPIRYGPDFISQVLALSLNSFHANPAINAASCEFRPFTDAL
jgi:hypothetical protein